MKNVKRVIIGLFFIFSFFSFFSPNAISATTIEDTTFPADVGKTYTWKFTYPAEYKGYKTTFKSEYIEKGVYHTIDVLIVNCTWRQYYPISGWHTFMDNELYMAANQTQNYLVFLKYMNAPVIIPTPINLTLVAKATYNSSVVNNTIISHWGAGYSDESTYNTKGFLTTYVVNVNGTMESKFVLDTGGDAVIPFGNYFLIFTVISVIALVYLKKQKIK